MLSLLLSLIKLCSRLQPWKTSEQLIPSPWNWCKVPQDMQRQILQMAVSKQASTSPKIPPAEAYLTPHSNYLHQLIFFLFWLIYLMIFPFLSCLLIAFRQIAKIPWLFSKAKCQKDRSFQRGLHLFSSVRKQAQCMGGKPGVCTEV